MDRRAARRSLILAGALVLFHFGGLGHLPLSDPDESRYTLTPRTMLESGDFVTPRLDGVLYFEKPPLFYWLNAASITVLGDGPWGARFWCAALGLASAGLAWALGRSMGGGNTGLFAAVVLGSAPLHLALSRIATIDMTLSFFMTATLACFWFARRGRAERAWWYAAFAAAAMALLAKGLVGVVLPGAVVFLYLVATREWALLRRPPWIGGIALFAALALPWHVLIALRHEDWLRVYVVQEHFLRYLTPVAHRPGPPWYFVPVFLVGFVPWLPLAPAALGSARLAALRSVQRERPDVVFLLVWAGFVFAFFSASKSKLPPYVLPMAVPVAVLLGLAFERLAGGGRLGRLARWGLAGCGAWALALSGVLLWLGRGGGGPPGGAPGLGLALLACVAGTVLGGLGAFVFARRRDVTLGVLAVGLSGASFFSGLWVVAPAYLVGRHADPLAAYLGSHMKPGDALYAFGFVPYSLAVALDRDVDAVAYAGELDRGISHLSPEDRARRFPTLEEFRPVWESEKTVWLVADHDDRDDARRSALSPGRLVLRSGRLGLYRNHASPSAGATDGR